MGETDISAGGYCTYNFNNLLKFKMSCDPTWEIYGTAFETDPVDTTTEPATTDDTSDDAASYSKVPNLYLVSALWLNIAGGLTYNALTSWASVAVTKKVTDINVRPVR